MMATTEGVVTKAAAKVVLARIKKGGAKTLREEAEALGLSYVRPLKQALVELCGGREAYQKLMGERKYPRKTKQVRRRRPKDDDGGGVEKMARAAGVRVVRKKKVEVAPASTKKREAGVVTVELDEGGAADEDGEGGGGTDDDRGGSVEEEAGGGGSAEDDEEAGEVDCVDGMSSGGGRAWAKEYWSAGVR